MQQSQLVTFIPLSKDPKRIITSQEDKNTWVRTLYAKLGNWKDKDVSQTPLATLHIDQPLLGIIRTDNIIIVDYDNTELFEQAVELNSSLQDEHKCNYIVKSLRKGGHFYYSMSRQSELANNLPWKNSDIDILTGPGHNAFAATPGDAGKVIVCNEVGQLTPLPEVMLPFLTYCILTTSTHKATVTTQAAGGTYSDDNEAFINSFILEQLGREDFLAYYNVPDIMPAGQSQSVMLKLAMRLMCDETLTLDKVRQVLRLYDKDSRKDTAEIDGLTNPSENIYVPDKLTSTLSLEHFRFKTSIAVYMDEELNSYILTFSDDTGTLRQLTKPNEVVALQLLEKLTRRNRTQIRKQLHTILPVRVTRDFALKAGFNPRENTYNTAYINKYLKAFYGEKPENYTTPDRMIKLTQAMWQDEYDFMMTHTHLRYSTFKHSPVIHHLMGVEGSGKDLTVIILTAGFPDEPQIVTPEDVTDKHRSYQVVDNSVFQEVGEWNPKDQGNAISGIKTVSGSNGTVSIRGMGTLKATVHTICKMWVLGNSWMRLHTGTKVDRRVHAVYMPNSLLTSGGGIYLETDIKSIMAEELENFYYYLGNEYSLVDPNNSYVSAINRQKSKSYEIYLQAVEGNAEAVARLLNKCDYEDLLKALHLVDRGIEDLDLKYNSDKHLVITLNSLRLIFGREKNSKVIFETLDMLSNSNPGSGKLNFESGQKKYVTIYGAPFGLDAESKTEELKYTK